MRIIDAILRVIYPPRCVSCAEILPIGCDAGLCEVCAPIYEVHNDEECGVCVQPLTKCECPNRYLKRHNIHRCGKLVKYTPKNNDGVVNQIIFRLKKSNSRDVARFLAKELAPIVLRLAREKKEKYILVGPPRSKSALRRYGYDHVVDLCKEVSKLTGIPYVNAILRIGNAGQQKNKTKKERVASATSSFAPNPKLSLKGKRVIVIDDIITSGATIAACARVVRAMGAKTVHCATIGYNYRYDQIYKN